MKRRSLVLSLGGWVLTAQAADRPPLLELELRWVRLSEPLPAGTLSSRAGLPRDRHTVSTASTAAPVDLPPLPLIRVLAGTRAQWSLQLAEPELRWAQVTQGPLRATLAGAAPAQWHLSLSPQWRGRREPMQVDVEWLQTQADGAQQRWHSQLPMRLEHWMVLARLPDQALQLRLREVLQE
ncbi:hypothetical protein HNQ51_003147 [Inhella inkyongensis]|uniref:Uncharacterized protein n=1 Tax=Inhella inkyongensis TaxID=392593 RepID=A0A840SBU7_9BURK|nr:hypothetical protein [Inhella inkyongensis]MBB5205820.1 hypothetical protein [Inhella inkyongensis]